MNDIELQKFSVEDLRAELFEREVISDKRVTTMMRPESLPTASLREPSTADTAIAKMSRATRGRRATPELTAMTSGELIEEIQLRQKGLYGVDDRRDLHEVTDPKLKQDAMTVAGFFPDELLGEPDGDMIPVKAQNLQELRNLCKAEKYSAQPAAAFGSGVLVAPDVVATAGHVVAAHPHAKTKIAFGWSCTAEQGHPTALKRDDVYSIREVIASQFSVNGEDWAIVRLDRPVKNRPFARLNMNRTLAKDQAIHIIGHPVGLPLKVAAGAKVTAQDAPTYFRANLDAFGGNSGSPVFNSETHEVEGLLISGSPDFVMNVERGCYVSLHCPINPDEWQGMCLGENCIRSDVFKSVLADLSAPVVDPPTPPDNHDSPDTGQNTGDTTVPTPPKPKPGKDCPPDSMEAFSANLGEFLRALLGK